MDRSKPGCPEYRIRFPRKSVTILRAWFNAHRQHPYPTEAEKSSLQEQTKLSIKQVSYWFTNARRRNKPFSSPQDDDQHQQDWSAMTLLDRWRLSPLESEPASLADIATAIASASSDTSSLDDNCSNASVPEDQSLDSLSMLTEPSLYWSMHSETTHDSRDRENWGRIRGRRRRQPKFRVDLSNSKDVEARKYQCTFCAHGFKTKYDWTRHESTQHLSFERWTCALSGPRIQLSQDEAPACSFCEDTNTSDVHLATHRYMECAEKPISARTFFRSDHLRQHLQQFHGIMGVRSSLVERCRSTLIDIRCRCGFCDEEFDEWAIRNDHIANHFRSGSVMREWKGSLGLDAATLGLVRNATAPQLTNASSVPTDTPSCCSDVIQTIEDPRPAGFISESDDWHFRHPRFNHPEWATMTSLGTPEMLHGNETFGRWRLPDWFTEQNALAKDRAKSRDFCKRNWPQLFDAVHEVGEVEGSAVALQEVSATQIIGTANRPEHAIIIEDLTADLSPLPTVHYSETEPDSSCAFTDTSADMVFPLSADGEGYFAAYGDVEAVKSASAPQSLSPKTHEDEEWLSLIHLNYDVAEHLSFDATQGSWL